MIKHFILTNGRSGSNYLTSYLNSHPRCLNYGEVLGEWTSPMRLWRATRRDCKVRFSYLDYFYYHRIPFYTAQMISAYSHLRKRKMIQWKRRSDMVSIGIKDFHFNLAIHHLTGYLMDRPEILVINLYRRNHFRRYLSWQALDQSGVAARDSAQKQGRVRQVILDTTKIIRELNHVRQETERQQTLVRGLPAERVLTVAYEDLFKDSDQTKCWLQRIAQFLGLEWYEWLGTTHRRILTARPKDVIGNFEAVREVLRGTEWETFLEESGPPT